MTARRAARSAAAGDHYSHIAAYLNERQLPVAGQEGVWQPNRIKRLLANRVYLGEARSGAGIANSSAHEGLVDLVTFQLAQRERKGPAITESAGSLLAGLCRCASCSYSMRSQSPRSGAVGVYRCSTNSVHGRCPGPSTVSALPIEAYVLDQFLARASSVVVHGVATSVDEKLVAAVAEREQSYRSVLLDTDLRKQIGDADHSLLVEKLHKEWQESLDAAASVEGPSSSIDSASLSALVEDLQGRNDVRGLRELLASAIQAVYVRPAASRARNLPIGDRVRIVWRDEEPLDLPRRGQRAEPRTFAW